VLFGEGGGGAGGCGREGAGRAVQGVGAETNADGMAGSSTAMLAHVFRAGHEAAREAHLDIAERRVGATATRPRRCAAPRRPRCSTIPQYRWWKCLSRAREGRGAGVAARTRSTRHGLQRCGQSILRISHASKTRRSRPLRCNKRSPAASHTADGATSFGSRRTCGHVLGAAEGGASRFTPRGILHWRGCRLTAGCHVRNCASGTRGYGRLGFFATARGDTHLNGWKLTAGRAQRCRCRISQSQ